MANPTARPWHRIIGRLGDGSPGSQHEQLCNAAGVGAIMLEHDGSAEGVANAELIVKAVNAHTGLTEAVEAAIEFLLFAPWNKNSIARVSDTLSQALSEIVAAEADGTGHQNMVPR